MVQRRLGELGSYCDGPPLGSVESKSVAHIVPERQHDVQELVLCELRELTGSGASVDLDASLMEAGLDSHATTELASRLRSLTGIELSPTLVFEQPTARAVATHLHASLKQPQTTVCLARPDEIVQSIPLRKNNRESKSSKKTTALYQSQDPS